ncbi:hypothetical protein HY947_05440 [Candidatus Gottesmanbacteria bacterium]|nr:hypothetical protein [Candidatus Gottesmanbacteria bacterium]
MLKVTRKNRNLQGGASLFLIFFILIAISTAVGVIGYKATRQMVQKQSQTLPSDWETYTSDKYGYSVSFPKGWKAEDKSTENSRKVTVSDSKGNAYLDVSAFKDDTMKDGPAIEKAISALEAKLRSDPALTVVQFKGQGPKDGGKIGGYIAWALRP